MYLSYCTVKYFTKCFDSYTIPKIYMFLFFPILFRIAKALKESENYSRGSTRKGNSSRNRRTVVRMQSELSIIVCYILNIGIFTGESFHAFFCFSVAVIACFLICWTPYHVQRMMFVVLTRTDTWSSHLMKIQEILHIVSGKYYFPAFYP